MIRVKAADISELGRATQGVKVMNVGDEDKIVAIARVAGNKKKKKNKDLIEGQESLLTEEISGPMGSTSAPDTDDEEDDDDMIDTTD